MVAAAAAPSGVMAAPTAEFAIPAIVPPCSPAVTAAGADSATPGASAKAAQAASMTTMNAIKGIAAFKNVFRVFTICLLEIDLSNQNECAMPDKPDILFVCLLL
jgi:hypothetical protein